jgi:hypothetical protein
MDNLKLSISFYTFMASAAYMFLKRFYLHQIVGFIYSILFLMLKNTVLPGYIMIQSVFAFDFFNFYKDPPLLRLFLF